MFQMKERITTTFLNRWPARLFEEGGTVYIGVSLDRYAVEFLFELGECEGADAEGERWGVV